MAKEPEFSIDNVVRMTYRLLNTHPEMFSVERLHINTAGLYHPDTKQIRINYRHDILSVLIHEVMHHYYPEWSEQRILSAEKFIMNHLSQRRAINLLKRLASIL